MNELALFAGVGGGILGGKLVGWRTVCAVEVSLYPASILCARQNDGVIDAFPIWDDVSTFDGKPWRGIVDVVSGGFPCQDISKMGDGAGIDGERSGLWWEMLRIVTEVRPKYVFIENSPVLRTRGIEEVLEGLSKAGYDAAWTTLSGSEVDACTLRDRLWILGITRSQRLEANAGNGESVTERRWQFENPLRSDTTAGFQRRGWRKVVFSADFDEYGNCPECDQGAEECLCLGPTQDGIVYQERDGILYGKEADWWSVEPDVGRMVDRVAARVDRLKAIGNGQIPRVAATAFLNLQKILEEC